MILLYVFILDLPPFLKKKYVSMLKGSSTIRLDMISIYQMYVVDKMTSIFVNISQSMNLV